MDTQGRIRIAFIGCGDVAELHYQGLSACSNAVLEGVFDIDTALMNRRATQWHTTAFNSLDVLLADARIDAVFVLTPIQCHFEHVMAALQAGKHVLVEKPLTNDAGQISEMAALAAAKGLQCMPAHNYIYSPDMYRLKKNIATGIFGRIGVSWMLYHIEHSEALCARYPGIIRQIGTHLLYTYRYLFGEATMLSATTTRFLYPHLDRDEQVLMVLKTPDGVLCNLFASFIVPDHTTNPWSFVIKVLGTRGSTQLSWQDVVFDRAIGTLSRSYGRYEDTYEHEIDYFVNQCVLRHQPPLSTLEDAARVLQMVQQAEQLSSLQNMPS